MAKLDETIREVIREELALTPDHPIEDDWPLYSLGADSLDQVAILISLEKRLGLKLDAGTLKVPLGKITVPYLVNVINEAVL